MICTDWHNIDKASTTNAVRTDLSGREKLIIMSKISNHRDLQRISSGALLQNQSNGVGTALIRSTRQWCNQWWWLNNLCINLKLRHGGIPSYWSRSTQTPSLETEVTTDSPQNGYFEDPTYCSLDDSLIIFDGDSWSALCVFRDPAPMWSDSHQTMK